MVSFASSNNEIEIVHVLFVRLCKIKIDYNFLYRFDLRNFNYCNFKLDFNLLPNFIIHIHRVILNALLYRDETIKPLSNCIRTNHYTIYTQLRELGIKIY